MRNGKRILSLALLVLLVVLLAPVAAHADPPKGDTHLHSWSVVSETPATCTSPGTKTWRCSACGDTYTEQTSPPLGHDFGNGRVTREATCTKEGEKTWTCSRCGATKTDTFPAKGHSPVSIPAVAATCTATGLTEGEQVLGLRRDPQGPGDRSGHGPRLVGLGHPDRSHLYGRRDRDPHLPVLRHGGDPLHRRPGPRPCHHPRFGPHLRGGRIY